MYLRIKLSSYFVISLLVLTLLPTLLSSASAQPINNPGWIANGWKQTIPNNAGPTQLVVAGNDLLSNETLNPSPASNDPVGVVFVTQPTLGTVSYDSGSTLVTYTPNISTAGLDVFTYQDCNSQYCTNVATIYITVTPGTNTPPVGQPMSFSVNQGSSYHLTVLGNDPDGDPWWITTFGGASWGNTILDPADPTNKTIIYTPTTHIPPYAGPDSFTYTLSDGHQHGNPSTVSVTINAVHNPPVAISQTVTAFENTPLSITLAATSNNVPQPTLTYTILTQPTHGTLSGTAPNIVYTPNLNFYGDSESFTFKVNDGVVDSNIATVTISVQHVYQPPVAVADSFTANQLSSSTFNVLANDHSIDISQGFPVTLGVASVTQPAHGTAVINSDYTITYTPNSSYFGADSFTYTANLVYTGGVVVPNTNSLPATVSITVNRVLSAPIITTPSQYTNNIHQTITGTGDASVTVKIYNGTTLLGTTTSDSSGNWSVPLTLSANANYILTAQETDVPNGLISPISDSITITIITAIPTLSPVNIQSSNNNHVFAKVGDTVTVTFTSSSTIQTPVVTIAGHTVTATNSGGNNWSAQYVMTSTDSEGVIPFAINFQDLAGNIGVTVTTTTDASSVLFDKTSPTITITQPANNAAIIATFVKITGTAADTGGSGLQKVEVSLDNGPFLLATGTSSWNFTMHPVQGLHSFTARATDNAGNTQTTSPSSFTITIPTPPVLSLVHVQSSNTNPSFAKVGDTVTLPFTSSTAIQTPVVTIAGHTVTATNSGGNNWSAQYVMTSTDTEGIVPFTIDFQDLTGLAGVQVKATTDASSVLFDKTSPTISIIQPANNAVIKLGSLAITGTAADTGGSGLQKVEVSLDNGPFLLATGTSSWTITANPAVGAHTITARATDNAGNVQTSSISITVVNNTSGKVTGGGGVGNSKFAFEVKSPDGNSFKGNLEFEDKANHIHLKATSITSLFVDTSGIKATFSGTALVNGHSGYTFNVYVEDHGEPGRNDVFSIQIFDSKGTLIDSVSGTLTKGNIVIHQNGNSTDDEDEQDFKNFKILRDT